MAKATLVLNRIGNDGYTYARREDGQWFLKEGYYSASNGWTTTKWQECAVNGVIESGLEAAEKGENSLYVGFGNLMMVHTTGLRHRLPQ